MTWSPTATLVTPAPISRTMPAPSWPRTRGNSPSDVEPVERIGVGVADAGRHDLDQHLAGARAVELELDDLERALGLERNGGTGLHRRMFPPARLCPGHASPVKRG